MPATAASELSKRTGFFGVNARDYTRTSNLRALLRRIAPAALERFYVKIKATPDTARFFPSEQLVNHAKSKQLEHWDALFAGELSTGYVERAERIGNVHARIGLDPTWYIGGYASVLEDIILQLGKPGLRSMVRPGQAAGEIATLVKFALLDMDLALSAYFKAEEQRRQAVIDSLGAALAQLSQGDFTARLEKLPPAYAQIERDFAAMREHINAALLAVSDGASGISNGAAEIRQASDNLASRTEQQAARLEETSATLTQIASGIHEAASGAATAKDGMMAARAKAEEGREIATEAVGAMQDIQNSSRSIQQIIDLIDGIAFQTNLLALNAGVEAARAGEAGRGFAVVASEVRSLAQRAAEAAAEIKQLIDSSGRQVDRGVNLVGKSGTAFAGIVQEVSAMSDLVAGIAELAHQQSESMSIISTSVREMDVATQQDAAMVEESHAAARNLASEAERLDGLVREFRLDRPAAGQVHAITPATGEAKPRPRQTNQRKLRAVGNLAVDAAEDWSEF